MSNKKKETKKKGNQAGKTITFNEELNFSFCILFIILYIIQYIVLLGIIII